MEKGVIRFEANVSIRPAGESNFGTRTEIKNLNSFRALTDSIEYEIRRQGTILDSGGRVVQDTMGWSETERRTFSQRGKEEAHDYRYFPEPDLPPLHIEKAWVEQIRESLPELPDAKKKRYTRDLGLSDYEAGVLTEERQVAEWFEAAVNAGGEPRAVANWMINVLFGLMNERKLAIEGVKVTPDGLASLIVMVDEGVINNTSAKEVLAEMIDTGAAPGSIVKTRGLAQISDEAQIAVLVKNILRENPEQVAAYLSGKESLRGWFVGQVMRQTGGQANPGVVNKVLSVELEKLRTGR